MKYIAHVGVKLKDGVTDFANYEVILLKTIRTLLSYNHCFLSRDKPAAVTGNMGRENSCFLKTACIFVKVDV